jgi:NagD protein
MPDIGSMIEMVASSTGKRPDIIIGKPNRYIVDAVSARTHLPVSSIAMVGDRLYTDIALGQSGVRTVLVLSGETHLEDLKDSPFQPDWIMPDLAGLLSALKSARSE